MYIDHSVFKSWIGIHSTTDGAIRNMIELQYADTGSHLYHPDTEAVIKSLFAGGTASVSQVCAFVINDLSDKNQIDSDGAVKMAYVSGTVEPFHSNGWLMQGGPAVVAIAASYAGYGATATKVIDWIVAQQITSGAYTYGGLWHFGDKTKQSAWINYWAYAQDYSIPFEDSTQVAHCCALHAFGKTTELTRATSTIYQILNHNNGAVPYVASKRDAEPVWGRPISPKAYSVEQTTRVVILLEALSSNPLYGPFDTTEARSFIGRHKVPGDGIVDVNDYNELLRNFEMNVTAGTSGDLNGDGYVDLDDINLMVPMIGHTGEAGITGDIYGNSNLWYDFIDFYRDIPVYPLADPNNPLAGTGKGELTFDKNLSVQSGFESPTNLPLLL